MAVKRSWIILFDLDNRLSVSLISRFRSHSDSSSLILLLLFLFLPNTMFSLTLSISAILQSTCESLPLLQRRPLNLEAGRARRRFDSHGLLFGFLSYCVRCFKLFSLS